MPAFNKFNAFVEHVAEKVHNLGADQLVVALCAAANPPVASNTVLADLTQISYTNLSSRNITTSSSAQTSGTYKLVLNDLTLTASGGSVAAFRYVVLYNDTPTSPADPLIGWYDYGSDLTLANGENLLIDFDGTNGVLTLV
jgi:poly-beta-hydroxyalkanoate depolymerase